jgi:hypothetical protein
MARDASVLTTPGAVVSQGIGGALALYAKYRDLQEALVFLAIAVSIALIACFVSAHVTAASKPKWERGGWEVG